MGCLVGGRYTHRADIYAQTSSRDPDTGQTVRVWSFLKTVPCQARSVVSEGIRTLGSSEDFRNATASYDDMEWVKIMTHEQISKRWRVRNIRNFKSNDPVWKDVDNNTDVRFEVLGSQPKPDPFGSTLEYETTLTKVQDAPGEQWT